MYMHFKTQNTRTQHKFRQHESPSGWLLVAARVRLCENVLFQHRVNHASHITPQTPPLLLLVYYTMVGPSDRQHRTNGTHYTQQHHCTKCAAARFMPLGRPRMIPLRECLCVVCVRVRGSCFRRKRARATEQCRSRSPSSRAPVICMYMAEHTLYIGFICTRMHMLGGWVCPMCYNMDTRDAMASIFISSSAHRARIQSCAFAGCNAACAFDVRKINGTKHTRRPIVR